jgi:hypothetical protein
MDFGEACYITEKSEKVMVKMVIEGVFWMRDVG